MGNGIGQSNASRVTNQTTMATLRQYGINNLKEAASVEHNSSGNNVTSTYSFNNGISVSFSHIGAGQNSINSSSINEQGYAKFPHDYQAVITEADGDKIKIGGATFFNDAGGLNQAPKITVQHADGNSDFLGPISNNHPGKEINTMAYKAFNAVNKTETPETEKPLAASPIVNETNIAETSQATPPVTSNHSSTATEGQSATSSLMNETTMAVLNNYGISNLAQADGVQHSGIGNKAISTYTFNNGVTAKFEHIGAGPNSVNAASIKEQGYAEQPHEYKTTVTEPDGDQIEIGGATFFDSSGGLNHAPKVTVRHAEGTNDYLGPISNQHTNQTSEAMAQNAFNIATGDNTPVMLIKSKQQPTSTQVIAFNNN